MVGERLRRIRKERKIGQRELAEAIGVTKATVSRYEVERGEPNDEIKVKIAKYFGVSLDYLLGIVDEPIQYQSTDRLPLVSESKRLEEKNLLEEFIDYLERRKKMCELGGW